VLLKQLQIDNIRQLEDTIIDVIYAGLLGGKMHHHEGILHVDWVAGRDVQPSKLSEIEQGLRNWYVDTGPTRYSPPS
jgi:COP9 signalosome complex subunit 7